MHAFYSLWSAAFPSVSVATDSAHVPICSSSHNETIFRSWKSLSMQVVCNPWNQLADVEAKYSESCHDSLSEYKLILHSFMNMATFKVVSFKVTIFSLSISNINCSTVSPFMPTTEIIPKSGTEAFYRCLEKSRHHTRATQNPTH